MAAGGATLSLPDALAEVPSQSDLPTFAIVRCRPGLVEFTIHGPASRLRASWIEARVKDLTRVSARLSKSLARRRSRVKQEKWRSTHPAAPLLLQRSLATRCSRGRPR